MDIASAALNDVKAELGIDSNALEKAKEEIEANLPKSESKPVADLSASVKVATALMEKPPAQIPDEQVEQIQTITTKVSGFLPVAEKCSFLLEKVENSEENIVKVNKELGSLNALIKKINGEGFFSRLFLLCTIKSTLNKLTTQIERLQDPVDKIEQLQQQLSDEFSRYLTEEATKKVEEAAAEAMEENSGFIDKVADALGL
ncbi:uncharacterized protein LOC142344138 [Convolutriloba macropyga]|uniref:uncharacterized protein LOC142344138 n=1 Tax=Convolutriloba macropyga TaxID=536237 RepID=UPI003F527A98